MSVFDIEYKVNTANYENVFLHLQLCSDKFVPNLNTRVDIRAYARKIDEKSIKFEAWKDGELIGLLAAYFNSMQTKIGYITNVSTIENYVGMGIASKLLGMCIEYGVLYGYSRICLEVFNENVSAISLYKKYDFTEVGRINNILNMEKYIK